MSEKTVEMTYFKSTKGTHVYHADSNAAVTSLYIARSALPTEPPIVITVTIKAK